MVGVLTSMKFALLRNSPLGMRAFGWLAGAILVALTWVGVLLADGAARADVTMLLLAAWTVAAAVGPVTMSGAGVLRPDYFSLLPLDRRRLALALLATTFPGVASGFLLLAAASLLAPAFASAHAVLAAPVALVAAVLAWVIAITLSRLVYSLLGAAMRTRFGVEISAIQFGLLLAGMLGGWIVVAQAVETVPQVLANGVGDQATQVLAWLPSSWAVFAVSAAGAGSFGPALGWLAALGALAGLLVAATVALLRTDSTGWGRRSRRPLGSRVLTGRTVLPRTALGAVVGKEIRQWWRDPWRSLELRTAIWSGIFIGLFALAAPWARELAPLAGLTAAFMLAIGACNLYGQDGSAVWLSVVGQRADTVRAEVRGRQLAVLALFVPASVAVTLAFVLVTGAWWSWPLVAAMLPALFGVASGVAVLISVIGVSPGVDPRRRIGPNDAGGDLSLQGQTAFWGTLLLVAPTIAAIVLAMTGTVAGPGGQWWVVGVGVLNGLVGYWLLGRLAIGYLNDRLPTVFTQIRYRRREDARSGPLARFARASQLSEDKARRAKEGERRSRVGADNLA